MATGKPRVAFAKFGLIPRFIVQLLAQDHLEKCGSRATFAVKLSSIRQDNGGRCKVVWLTGDGRDRPSLLLSCERYHLLGSFECPVESADGF